MFLTDWSVILQGGTPLGPVGDGDFRETLDEIFAREKQGLQVACRILKDERLFEAGAENRKAFLKESDPTRLKTDAERLEGSPHPRDETANSASALRGPSLRRRGRQARAF